MFKGIDLSPILLYLLPAFCALVWVNTALEFLSDKYKETVNRLPSRILSILYAGKIISLLLWIVWIYFLFRSRGYASLANVIITTASDFILFAGLAIISMLLLMLLAAFKKS